MIQQHIQRGLYAHQLLIKVFCFFIFLTSLSVFANGNLVRYTNDKGNVVIDYTIPAEYVARGYEIITSSGKVIDVIPPALTPDEIAKQKALNELRESYLNLRKRYSHKNDILAAKERKLNNVNAKILVIETSIASANTAIELLITDAAKQERLGRKVSPLTLDKLTTARKELAAAEEILATRQQELINIEKTYSAQYQRFIEGEALANKELNNKTTY